MSRPSKYETDAAQRLYETLANGCSVTEFAAQEGVSRSTVYKWADEHDEFSDALKRGQDASQAFWENEVKSMMREGKQVNEGLVKLYLANRFDWHDKQSREVSGPEGGPIKTENNVRFDPSKLSDSALAELDQALEDDENSESDG